MKDMRKNELVLIVFSEAYNTLFVDYPIPYYITDDEMIGKFATRYGTTRNSAMILNTTSDICWIEYNWDNVYKFIQNHENLSKENPYGLLKHSNIINPYYDNDNIVHINGIIHEEVYERSENVLVIYYSPDCPGVLKLKPIIERISEQYNNRMKIYALDTSENHFYDKLSHKIIRGTKTPLLVIYSNKEKYVYKGEKKFEEIETWIHDIVDSKDEI